MTEYTTDADRLFASGQFVQADAAYERVLATDPDDAHALAQRGYVALLSNKLDEAAALLTRAIELAPSNNPSKVRLAECFGRQGDLARAVPLLREADREAEAAQYTGLTGKPYAVSGDDTTQLPFLVIDPLPMIEGSVNGAPPVRFFLDTGASFGFSAELAERAGVRDLAAKEAGQAGRKVTLHLGVVDSLQLGGVELRNVPVTWHDARMPRVPEGPQPEGAIGTTIFYQFLSTMDYKDGSLILRQKTPAQLQKFQEEAGEAGAATMPFWMAAHHLFAQGGLNGRGPMLFFVDTGGPGFGVATTESLAAEVGETVDSSHPRQFGTWQVFPFTMSEVALGSVVRRGVPGLAGSQMTGRAVDRGFDAAATITHEFFRPLAITFDFGNMTLYVNH